jgi:fructose/tagatose bisphosphate aldolase
MLKVLMFDEARLSIEIEVGRIFSSEPGKGFGVWDDWQLWVLVRIVVGCDREWRITVIEQPYNRVVDTRVRTIAIAKI